MNPVPMMRLTAAVLALLLALPLSAQRNEDVDYLQLASLLARDGHWDRAQAALKDVDTAAEDFDALTYHTVSGLIAINQQRHADAIEAFRAAVAAGQAEPSVHLYMAQAHFALEQYREAIAAILASGEAGAALSGSWLMRAQAHWMLGEKQPALDVLAAARSRFPANLAFLRREVFYLVETGLFREAAERGRHYLSVSEGSEADYLAIGTALRRSRELDEAARFLEAARLKFPDSLDVGKALSQVYMDQGHHLAAAEIFASVAARDPAFLPEAAELLRRAGRFERALALNARIGDQSTKLKQRVGLLIELKRYDQVAGSEDALHRVGLLEDEDIRYALAYAWFKAGDFDAVERHLKALKRVDLFRKATELRRVMAECADKRWLCA